MKKCTCYIRNNSIVDVYTFKGKSVEFLEHGRHIKASYVGYSFGNGVRCYPVSKHLFYRRAKLKEYMDMLKRVVPLGSNRTKYTTVGLLQDAKDYIAVSTVFV